MNFVARSVVVAAAFSGIWASAQQCRQIASPATLPWEQRVAGTGMDFSSLARALDLARTAVRREIRFCREVCDGVGGTFSSLEESSNTFHSCSGGDGASPARCDVFARTRCEEEGSVDAPY